MQSRYDTKQPPFALNIVYNTSAAHALYPTYAMGVSFYRSNITTDDIMHQYCALFSQTSTL